jgi:hypothetical protein
MENALRADLSPFLIYLWLSGISRGQFLSKESARYPYY